MGKLKIFMIMPFLDEFLEIYQMLKEHFDDDYEFTHAGDDISTQQNILKDIVQMIYESDVIVADLTGRNANVFYELGIAHTLGKKVISISQNLDELPFDIRSYRATEYSTHFKKFDHLVKELTRYLDGASKGSVAFGNPVTDFLNTIGDSEKLNIWGTCDNPHDDELGDKGFIDNLADIEEEVEGITNSMGALTSDMDIMASGIKKCTDEINRVHATSGGSGEASFRRKQVRKAANYISDYSKSLRNHNSSFLEKWPNVEKNCLQLLANEHAFMPENKKGLIDFLKSLYSIKNKSLSPLKCQIESFIQSFTGLRGIESSLNQAVNSLEADTKQFGSFIEQMNASIDRILNKGKFVVGEIEYIDD